MIFVSLSLFLAATLFPDDLKKNGYDGVEAIYDVIYRGKGKMPGFGYDCVPKGQCTFGPRLSDEEIQQLSEYIVEQGKLGWPN